MRLNGCRYRLTSTGRSRINSTSPASKCLRACHQPCGAGHEVACGPRSGFRGRRSAAPDAPRFGALDGGLRHSRCNGQPGRVPFAISRSAGASANHRSASASRHGSPREARPGMGGVPVASVRQVIRVPGCVRGSRERNGHGSLSRFTVAGRTGWNRHPWMVGAENRRSARLRHGCDRLVAFDEDGFGQ